MTIRLSTNFTLDELTRSAIARRLSLDNTPTAADIERLRLLVERGLQPVRDHFGPVVILSGYRANLVNTAAGSSDRSAHPWGLAADFVVPGRSTREVVEWIRDNLPAFDQAIDEFGEWVHLGIMRPATGQVRRQILEAYKAGGKTRYRKPRP